MSATKHKLRLHGHEWDAKKLSVCMGFDALRLSLGDKPAVFTPKEIVLWLACMARQQGASITTKDVRP